jgi:hypothetical protein
VAARGEPGEDRWQLFNSYYRTIYDRERQKAVPPYAAILSRLQSTIDQLHHDIGFWLQLQGESAGDKTAGLRSSDFERIVDAYLAELGHEMPERGDLVAGITDLAQQRLVFLTSRIPGELSFDVRSLQEFMAAECLTSGAPEKVRLRLKAIAAIPYWRNVFLFAAGKCFADVHSRHLQDNVRTLCEDLNNSEDFPLAVTLAGSELALDILESGVVATHPRYARNLAHIALKLVSRPILQTTSGDASLAQRLAVAYRPELNTIYSSDLSLYVGQTDTERTVGAWPLIFALDSRGIEFATELRRSQWPSNESSKLSILSAVPSDIWKSDSFLQTLDKDVLRIAPREILQTLREVLAKVDVSSHPILSALETVLDAATPRNERHIVCSVNALKPMGSAHITVCPIDVSTAEINAFQILSEESDIAPGWIPTATVAPFLAQPSGKTLCESLKRAAKRGWSGQSEALNHLPWPFAACLSWSRDSAELALIANAVEQGDLWDSAAWVSSEEYWIKEGIDLQDIGDAFNCDSLVRWDLRVPPFGSGAEITRHEYEYDEIMNLFYAIEKSTRSEISSLILWRLFSAAGYRGGLINFVSNSQIEQLIEKYTDDQFDYASIGVATSGDPVERHAELFEWLGKREIYWFNSADTEIDARAWARIVSQILKKNGESEGLLKLAAHLASVGSIIDWEPSGLDGDQSASIKFAKLIIRLTRNPLEAPEHTAEIAFELTQLLGKTSLNQLMGTVANRIDDVTGVKAFALKLWQLSPLETGALVSAVMRSVRDKDRSELQWTPHRNSLLLIPLLDRVVLSQE